VARIFHNKLVGYSREFINQYFSYFSPLFLFSDDAWLKTRYAVPETGPLYLATLLMLCAYLLPTKKKLLTDHSAFLFILWWLLIAPIPAALTVIESPNIRRSLIMLAPLLIIASGGWVQSFAVTWKKVRFGYLIGLVILAEFVFFTYVYVKQSDAVSSLYRSDGLPEIARYVVSHQSEADQFLIFESYDFPLYYLFETNNFSPEWSSKFREALAIDQMDNVKPVPYKCSADMTPELLFTQATDTIFIEPQTCKTDVCYFEDVDQIRGVNLLTYYKVLRALDKPSTDPACQLRLMMQ
jgi:hypothetical protein